MILRTKENSIYLTKAVASLGLLAFCSVGLACGEMDSEAADDLSSYSDGQPEQAQYAAEIGEGQAPEYIGAEALRDMTHSRYPISDYFSRDGSYFLECRTGAQLSPLDVQPDADISGWMRECMDEIVSYDVSDAQINECRSHVFDFAFLSGRDGSGTSGITPKDQPTANFSTPDGTEWTRCNSFAVDAIAHPPEGAENYEEFYDTTFPNWLENCKNGSVVGGGPSVGVIFSEVHREMGSRITGTGGSNPVCGGLGGDDVELRLSGSTMTCSTTGKTISGVADAGVFRVFQGECLKQDGEVETNDFVAGSDIDREVLYLCSSNGETVLHSRGGSTFRSFSSECRGDGGTVLRREFSDAGMPDDQPRPLYLCTSTGETLPHGDDVYEYEGFLFACSQTTGRVLTTVPKSIPGVGSVSAIGRDGRDEIDKDDLILMATVTWGYDEDRKQIWICMPKGSTLSMDADYNEFYSFKQDCLNNGGSVVKQSFHIQERTDGSLH